MKSVSQTVIQSASQAAADANPDGQGNQAAPQPGIMRQVRMSGRERLATGLLPHMRTAPPATTASTSLYSALTPTPKQHTRNPAPLWPPKSSQTRSPPLYPAPAAPHLEVDGHVTHGLAAQRAGVVVAGVGGEAGAVHEVPARQLLRGGGAGAYS